MTIKPITFFETGQGWCVRIIIEGLSRTFRNFSSQLAAERAGNVQMGQIARGAPAYTQLELRQLGLCGEPGSYEAALSSRRAKFGVVLDDGSVKRLG